MFRSEWKKLKSPMMIIVILALILVPFLYNSIFLSAFWDPYGKTENIKVAVVNEDKATKFEGEKIDIGNQFIKKLKKNDDFDWQYLSRKEAAKQLRAGDIYMTVVIPKKFSHNATTLLDDHPKKIELEYYLNPAKNYSGTQVSSAAAKQLNEKIRKSVTKQYSSAIFGSLKKIAKGFEDASEGSAKLEDGAKKTTDGAKTLTTNLGKLTSGTNTLSTNLTKANEGSAQISTGLNTLTDGTQTLAEKSGELSSGLNQLDSSSNKLNAGAADLQTGATKLRAGTEKAAAGTSELNRKLPAFTAGLDQLNARAQEANASLAAVNDAADTLKQDLSTRREALEANVANIKAVIASSETLTEEEKNTLLGSIATMEQNVQNLAQQESSLDASLAQANDATDKINQLAVGGQNIASAVSQLNDGQAQLLAGSKQLEQGQIAFNQGLTAYTDGVRKAAAGSSQLTAGSQKLATGANDASTASDKLTSALGQLSDGAVSLSSGAGQLTDGASRLADGNSKLVDGANTLKTELGKGAKDATVKPSNDRDNMLAEPVVLKEHDYSTVNNYGSGLAAYILSIALFAGALMFSSVYQIRPEHGETLTWRFLVGKLSIILPIGALQGIAASVAIIYVLDADVASAPALYGFAALTGMTFITLLFTLTMLFGRVGQFTAFLLLLLQIGGSGGTFPVEMTPAFFQTIHRFLPMTYSVTGFREALGIGVTDTLISNSQVLGLILFSALAISFAGALGGKRILLSTKARKRHDTV
ncbi:YhgE/Pip family protein [Exiguobacterium sp. S22-S28]|uniref:YhgE/Pip family protein n=1 Tax=Exiguobacterium sp. S22-S28 TaxID=3342768 RepID=UPI00372CF18D